MSAVNRFAEGEALLKAGRRDEGLDLIAAELEREPGETAKIYQNFTAILIRDRKYEMAEHWSRIGVARYPKDTELLNILGVALRRLGRHEEALTVLDRALRLNPKHNGALVNKGNIFNDMRDPRAIDVFTRLVRATPTSGEHQRSLGRAYTFAGELEKAQMRYNLAVKLKPDYLDGWLDLTNNIADVNGPEAALEAYDRGIAAVTDADRLREAKVIMLRRAGRQKEAEQFLSDVLRTRGDVAWAHYQLGVTLADQNRGMANLHYEKAVELAPENGEYQVSLAESYSRTRTGDEAANLERAYQVLKIAIDQVPPTAANVKVASDIFVRVADYDAAEALGDFKHLGRLWAGNGRHTALLSHLARVRAPEDREELVEQHRIWGRLAEAAAARRPITKPGPRAPDGKIRLGFMSSDLRAHPVAYFSLPIFEHYDRSRFEIYCYSFYQGQADGTQQRLMKLVDQFRWNPDISDFDAAQMIADDQLDMLIELGGSTHMNKLMVMAYKPAPLQASWLGYPHSAGLATIDYLIVDPYMMPERDGLLIEKPLILPHGWFCLGQGAFHDGVAVETPAPVIRNGYVTFGTANNPYKYSRDMVRTWARVVAGVPGARFMFVRPEGGSPSFRSNLEAIFAQEGVSADRLIFEAVRGRHLPFYNQMDVSLDSFPQTGGTTTCESLWMGVPVVTLVGETLFERLSYSSLMNGGMPELCARSTDEFVRIGVELGKDPARIDQMRAGLRDRMRASPLGQTKQWATDFLDLMGQTVEAARR